MSTDVKQELKKDRRRDRRRKRILGIIILIIVLLLCAGLAFAGETTVVNQYDTNLTEDFVQKVYADGINKYSKDKMSFDEISKYVARLIGADLKGSNLFTDEQIKYIQQYVRDNGADIDNEEIRNQVVVEVSKLIDEQCIQNYNNMLQIDSNLKELIEANTNLDNARYQELLQADKNLLLWLNTARDDLNGKINDSTDALNKRIDKLEKQQGNNSGNSVSDNAEIERLKERLTQLENQRTTVVSQPVDLTEINNHESRISELEAREIPDITNLTRDLANLTAGFNNLQKLVMQTLNAKDFDNSKSYGKGEYVVSNGELYVALTEGANNINDASQFAKINIEQIIEKYVNGKAEEIKNELNSTLTINEDDSQLIITLIGAKKYTEGNTYQASDYVVKDGNLYIVGEPSDEGSWTRTDIKTIIEGLKSAITDINNKYDSLLSTIDAKEQAIKELISATETVVNKNTTDIAANRKELEDKLKTVDDANKQLQNDINSKVGADQYNTDIQNINNTTNSITESVKNLKGQIEGLGTAASQEEVDNLKGELDALATQIENLNVTINQFKTENKEKYNYRYEEVDGQPTLYIEEINN